MIDIRYKESEAEPGRLEREFTLELDPRLRAVVFEADHFVFVNYGKHLTLTCVYRTPEENAAVGGHQYSGHMDCRCVDVRSRNLTNHQIKALMRHLSDMFSNPLLHVKHHDSGHGRHFHFGIRYAYRDKPVP